MIYKIDVYGVRVYEYTMYVSFTNTLKDVVLHDKLSCGVTIICGEYTFTKDGVSKKDLDIIDNYCVMMCRV